MFQVASHPSSFHHAPSSRHASQPQSAPTLQLPRTLTRPPFAEVSREAIVAASEELGSVPPEYIRRGLRSKTAAMLAGLSALAPYVPSCLPRNHHLPSSFSTPLRSPTSPTEPSPPTHVLAITSSKTHSNEYSIFPIHALVLASQCALLPRLSPVVHSRTVQLPVVPISLPSQAAFSILHTYLYTHRLDKVLKGLFPVPSGFLNSLSHETVRSTLASGSALHQLSSFLCSSASCNLQTLMSYAAHVKELWQDMVALGLCSPELWDTVDLAWEVVLGALNLAASAV